MKKILSLLILTLTIWGLLIQSADAKRFGGGRSFGMQRSASSFSRPATYASPAQPKRNWLAPLAGLAMGGLLASLFFSHGIGSALLSWLFIGGIALVAWSWFQRRRINARPYSPNNAFQANEKPFNVFNQTAPAAATATAINGFDKDSFLRDAKVQFIRLQAAYDSKNINDIRDFTAPQVFAEIQMQLQERQNAVNQTEVISLEAELLDVANEPDGMVASVSFSGAVREEVNGPIEPLKEIWHFQKQSGATQWVVAGLQQQ